MTFFRYPLIEAESDVEILASLATREDRDSTEQEQTQRQDRLAVASPFVQGQIAASGEVEEDASHDSDLEDNDESAQMGDEDEEDAETVSSSEDENEDEDGEHIVCSDDLIRRILEDADEDPYDEDAREYRQHLVMQEVGE